MGLIAASGSVDEYGSDGRSWSDAGSDSEAASQESAASEQTSSHMQPQPKLSVQVQDKRFHKDELDIFASPHRPQFQKLQKKYAVRGISAGVQTDKTAASRDFGTQAQFDAFASITGVEKRIQLFESARFTEDGPSVIKFFAEYKLSAKFALENTNVHSGFKSRQEFNLQELRPAEVGELKSLAALHLSRVLDQHKQTPAVHTPGASLVSSLKLLQSVLLGGQADAHTVVLRARTDFTNASHPLFSEYQQADRLIRAQLGTKAQAAAESTAVANLANAELFMLDTFVCATAELSNFKLSLDGVMHACSNVKIREAAMRWTATVREEMRRLVQRQLEEATESQGEAAENGLEGSTDKAAENAPQSFAESVLGSGKFSDWISLAQIVRPLEDEPVKMSIKMRHRIELYGEERVIHFLEALQVPLDLGYSDESGTFRPSQALQAIEDKLEAEPHLATLPSRHKRELNRFVFEVQNLESLAIVRFSATYVELLSAQKSGILRLADSHIATLEKAERARHLRTYAKTQERKYAAKLQGNISGILQLAAGSHQASFASRDAAASQIQACFRAYVIRRSMHHVKLLTAVLKADAKARQQVRHKIAVPRCSNIRHWLSGVTPWSLGSSSSRGLLDFHLASPTSQRSLLHAEHLAFNRPHVSVKNDLLDLYLEQTTAYSNFAVAEMNGGAIWRPPVTTVRFVGQQWKQHFSSAPEVSAAGAFSGASVTRGSSGFTHSSTTSAKPSELVQSATQAVQKFTSVALSPPGSPRAIQNQLKEFRWDAVPAKLGAFDTEAHLISGTSEAAMPGMSCPKLDTQASETTEHAITETEVAEFVSPFELIPLGLEQTVDALLDSSKYKRIQQNWHTWRSRMQASGQTPQAKTKPKSLYSADPNLIRSLPTASSGPASVQTSRTLDTRAASVRFDLPRGAKEIMDLEQVSYDWDAYFAQERKMFSGTTNKDSAPVEAAVGELYTGQGSIRSTATPLERATLFNRYLHTAGQHREPMVTKQPRPQSATVTAIRQWQSRGSSESKPKSATQSLTAHKYTVVDARTMRRNSSVAKLQSRSPAAKYSRYTTKATSKTKYLARPQSAHATLRGSAGAVPSTGVGGARVAVGPTQSYQAPSQGTAWAFVQAGGAAAPIPTRHHGRSIGNHYADVWSSNKGQINVDGKWTTKRKVKLHGYDQFGMAK